MFVEKGPFLVCYVFVLFSVKLIYCNTSGQPWPLPQSYKVTPNWMPVSKDFNFEVVDKSCDILEAAVTRYAVMLFGNPSEDTLRFSSNSELSTLQVDLMEECESYPYLYMDESCTV